MGPADGLVRDTDGRWFLGFSKFLGITSPLCAELWAIYIGLRVMCDNDFEYVMFNQTVLRLLSCFWILIGVVVVYLLYEPLIFIERNVG
ncbi:hypothetical protein GQ457_14G006420 [Hibiscus cannabinus]